MQSFTVNSCAAGASLPNMARRRTFLERPHDHLRLAAAAHARITSSEEPAPETDAELAPVSEPTAQSRRSRTQRRNAGGKFA